ncbi:hypothetical protein TPHA_0D01730 [Tetrapisispora phaffii CBS 4417]|uniref:Glutaredoxin-like protein n=1 Tax=Tetrapisispora phaffii (strain ATCC 24235 / CBS 4417 / NBRC 1672 / NRRL Y-8282 / UCD 70-5) TaxID=1071381 RepID=G8BSJ2_TETPH|nr:hypothetical protein TPHA_0D01730 [Tetrapisispora phaffii CBS 4417]CCE62813.1 hypothetical protein TPHA_0D01730 [Tetrapisispora phaffii CBS 4417]
MIQRVFSRSIHYSRPAQNLNNVRLTLFSKANCGLCTKAKTVLSSVLEEDKYKDKVQLNLIDIDSPNNKEWWDKYCFDIPVLHIENNKSGEISKIFHKMTESEVKDGIHEME